MFRERFVVEFRFKLVFEGNVVFCQKRKRKGILEGKCIISKDIEMRGKLDYRVF